MSGSELKGGERGGGSGRDGMGEERKGGKLRDLGRGGDGMEEQDRMRRAGKEDWNGILLSRTPLKRPERGCDPSAQQETQMFDSKRQTPLHGSHP